MIKVHSFRAKYLVATLALCLMVLGGCSKNSTEPTVDADPTGFYKIDVKTTFTNKLTATGVKNGHICYMRNKGNAWCKDVEIGENYSFWIKDVTSTPMKDSTLIQFSLELRKPSAIFEGDLIEARNNFAIKYPDNPNYDNEGNVSASDAADVEAYVKQTIDDNVEAAKIAGAILAVLGDAPQIKDITDIISNSYKDDSKVKRRQIEGALIGVITFSEMRDMIKKNIEK